MIADYPGARILRFTKHSKATIVKFSTIVESSVLQHAYQSIKVNASYYKRWKRFLWGISQWRFTFFFAFLAIFPASVCKDLKFFSGFE